jgi:hypothetical protein
MFIELLTIILGVTAAVAGLHWTFRKLTSPSHSLEAPLLPVSGLTVHLPKSAQKDQALAFVDSWVELLEQEEYEAAYKHTAHRADMGWSTQLIRQTIKGYGQRLPAQRVTLVGRDTDVRQRKEFDRYAKARGAAVGQIWYDLNIDEALSDLTATFLIYEVDGGLAVVLDNIHVM